MAYARCVPFSAITVSPPPTHRHVDPHDRTNLCARALAPRPGRMLLVGKRQRTVRCEACCAGGTHADARRDGPRASNGRCARAPHTNSSDQNSRRLCERPHPRGRASAMRIRVRAACLPRDGPPSLRPTRPPRIAPERDGRTRR
eukprot:1283905-Prymnesium_polylepis.1